MEKGKEKNAHFRIYGSRWFFPISLPLPFYFIQFPIRYSREWYVYGILTHFQSYLFICCNRHTFWPDFQTRKTFFPKLLSQIQQRSTAGERERVKKAHAAWYIRTYILSNDKQTKRKNVFFSSSSTFATNVLV